MTRTVLTYPLFAVLLAACAFAQSGASTDTSTGQDVSGKWSGSLDITLPNGTVQKDTAVLILKQDGSVITGSAGQTEDKQSEIQSGNIDGREIRFSVEVHGGMPIHFQLHLDGGHLKGDLDGESPDGKLTAKLDVLRVAGETTVGSPSQELFKEISNMDSLLFTAYNKRDLQTLKKMFAEDLEFYHDVDGLTLYPRNMDSLKRNFESSTVMRRELVDGTLEIYPIKGYGAIEIGVHRFYTTNPGQKEILTATAKFVHVWHKKDGEWKVSRVVSYGHR